MGPKERSRFLQWMAGLFLPVFWLLFKIGILQALLIAVVSTVHQLSPAARLPESFQRVLYWGFAVFDLTAQVLALYSLPVCNPGGRAPHMAAGDPAGSRGVSRPTVRTVCSCSFRWR